MYEYSKIENLQKCEEHYDRMVAYAESQPATDIPDPEEMGFDIGEAWFIDDCACCQAYYAKCDIAQHYCFLCPLFVSDACCAGLWDKLADSTTWSSFAENAKLVREYITTIKVALLMAT